MKCIAITGGIASGKSLFGQMLSRLGVEVLDADEIIRNLHRPNGEGANAVARVFGRAFLTSDGATDRTKLGDLVFRDHAARRRLNALSHPLARREALRWRDARSSAPFKAILVPLLFESAWEKDWRITLTIESPLAARLARLAERGLSPEAAQARIDAQLSPAERRAKADIIIFNDGDPATLSQAASRIFKHMEHITQ